MTGILFTSAFLIPLVSGLAVMISGKRIRKASGVLSLTLTLVSSALIWYALLSCPGGSFVLLKASDRFVLSFSCDGASQLFAGLIATLWPLTVIYALEYMEDDERPEMFFGFFLMAFGATAGIAFAGNYFTLYCFYEALTLTTVPLVLHYHTEESVRAARTYFTYSLGGAAMVFLSMLYFTLTPSPGSGAELAKLFYLAGFAGFSVKSAVFPLHAWLPRASVAPTPVTALLHAVAVVKSGVFAVIRLTWCVYGDLSADDPVRGVLICVVSFSILYGSSMAVRETDLKRRLAYSTVANLSYILFGALLMNVSGLAAAFVHMLFHAVMKITAFFAAGSVLHASGRRKVYEMDGMGRLMPLTFTAFTLAALSLTGVPPFAGFVSKWQLLTAAAEMGGVFAYAGCASIIFSALLTAIYMFTTVRRAFFSDAPSLNGTGDPGWRMILPMALTSVLCLVMGLAGGFFADLCMNAAGNMPRWI
ncbi:MAG: proton-conducting membrane transporter [Eubacteriaceae bacterium]|nr:proton-conducting membrane transporter [Eubacteriaceae bacterium]